MKKVILVLFLGFFLKSYSQVIIGGVNGTAPSNKKTAVLLEFEAGQNKGIILPSVRVLPSTPNVTPGTFLVDASNASSTKAKVKVYAPGNVNSDNLGWIDLSSENESDNTSFMAKQPNSVTELSNAKAIIGANTTTANGVLVLESTTKAMVLPQVNNTDDIKDPSPGMMVYVTGTNKRLAVYNGSKWTYWSPN